MNKLLLTFVLLLTFALNSCSQDNTQAADQTKNMTQSDKPVLAFFLNPSGGPCIMQADILKKLPVEIQNLYNIRLVQTNVKEDQNIFYAYGIRALPTLILTDSQGKEIKRLPPGVQSGDTIIAMLKQAGVQ